MRRLTLPLTVAAASLVLTGCSAGQDPAPTATVTVTATPSAEPTTATPEPTTEAPAETAEADPAPETEAPVVGPTAAEQAPATEATAEAAPADVISSQGMQGDDYMVFIGQDVPLEQAQAAAPGILAAKIQELTGTPQAADIDLVAVQHVGTGMLLAKQPMPGGKWG